MKGAGDVMTHFYEGSTDLGVAPMACGLGGGTWTTP